MTLKERCKVMIDTMGIPVTKFCRNINLSTHSYYFWINGKFELSEKRQQSINDYLKKYNF